MRMKGKISSGKIYTSVFLLLFVWIGTQLLAPVVVPGLGMVALLTGGVIISGLFLSFYLPSGKQKIIPAAFLTALFFTWVYLIGWQRLVWLGKDFMEWLSDRSGVATSVFGYEMLVICLVGVVFILFSLAAERIFWLKALTGGGLLAYLLVGMLQRWEVHLVTVSLILFFAMAVTVELMGSRISGNRRKGKASVEFIGGRAESRLTGSKRDDEMGTERINGRRGLVYLLPFLLLFWVGLLLLPRRQEPYDWRLLKELYRSARAAVIIIVQNVEDLWNQNREGFGLPISGFSGTGELGEGYVAGNKEQLRITLTSGKRLPVYLTGNVFDTFDGESWSTTGGETVADHWLDQLETLYAVERYDGENKENYLSSATAEITYTDLRTEFLFTPQKIHRVIFADGADELREKGGQWSFLKKQGYGTNYTIAFTQMNLHQPFFHTMLEQESRYSYGENTAGAALAGLEEGLKIDLPEIAAWEKTLKERSDAIQVQYIQTTGVSVAVSEFITETVKNCRTDYEKCKAIEQALNGTGGLSFRYTARPGKMPENKQFPDYFLLESREGYCTYYATAFVLMVRELGIPARYVQGFCVEDEKLGKEAVSVTGGMTHAWPEVYFSGIGWIPFEPTPGYSAGRYRFWQPVWQTESVGAVAASLPTQPSFFEIPKPDIPVVLPDSPDHFWPTLGVVVLLAVVVAGGFLIGLDAWLRRRAYRHCTPEEKLKTLVRTNLRILRYVGFQLGVGETIEEFGRRVGQGAADFPLSFIGLFEEAVYGNSVIDEEMLTAVLTEKNQLFDKIKNYSKWRYYRIRLQMLVTEGVKV